MGLEEIQEGDRILIDASIFIYHFTKASAECRHFLEDCEQGKIQGVTSVVVLAEVSHRLMALEALAKGLITRGNTAQKLRENPEVVRNLETYQEQLDLIPRMGISIMNLDLRILQRAAELRRQYGLLTNDSLLAATASLEEIKSIASADHDFERVDTLRLFQPSDL